MTESPRPDRTGGLPTWDGLIADVRSGAGSEARHDVGEWAMGQVRTALGDDWPRRWLARHRSLPAFLDRPGQYAFAYSQLIEGGLRLHALQNATRLRRLTREWSQDLQTIREVHVRLQLEVAALAASLGAKVEFEAPIKLPRTSRPADVLVTHESHRMIVECFAVYNDRPTSEAMQYDRMLGTRLQLMALGADVVLSGHWEGRLSEEETRQLLAKVEAVIAEVADDAVARPVTMPGVSLNITPGPHPEGQSPLLEGPERHAAGWPRARGVINAKARDWLGAPYPVWLRFDLLDGTWLFSSWAQQQLPQKTEWIAALIADAVSDAEVAGVVVSCGQQVAPNAVTEAYTGTGGITGLRHRLDALRMRETIIIPLTSVGGQHMGFWRALYDAEPSWCDNALMSASLPGLTEIEIGWSVPQPGDPMQ